MEVDRSIRSTDGRVLAAMVVVLAVLVGLAGFSLNDADVPTAAVPAAVTTIVAQAPAPAVETWHSDESATGTRPDSSH